MRDPPAAPGTPPRADRVLTCDGFPAFVAAATEGTVDFVNVPVTGVGVHGDTATVSTLENVGSDADGDPTLQAFDYTLVRKDGTWLVDEVRLGD